MPRLVFAAADAAAMQERRNDFGVVDNHRVAGAQQLWQIADREVLKLRGAPARTTRSRAASRGVRGPQRDAILRQDEIKQIRAHVSARRCSVSLPPPLSHHR